MGPRRFTEKTPCRDDINADLAIALAMWFDGTVRRAKLAVALTKTAKDRFGALATHDHTSSGGSPGR
jgi:hypothetical protein